MAGFLLISLAAAPGAGHAASMFCRGGDAISLKAYGGGVTYAYIKNKSPLIIYFTFARALLSYDSSGKPSTLFCQYMVMDRATRMQSVSTDDFNITDFYSTGLSNCKPRFEANWTASATPNQKSCVKGDPALCELTC
ncbi:MAG: hypothetical protein HYY66_04830 [Candidatus Tectomicrobia bacterium]|nr:hypothetical protein [Candidatus Tectomicrobia bacterium]